MRTKITNPMKLPASQKRDKKMGINVGGNMRYNLVKKGILRSFHNSQLRFKFRYTFLVYCYFDSPYFGVYDYLCLWCLALTITSFGVLFLPINAKNNDMTQHKKNTSKLSPHCYTEGDVSQITKGMYQTWWNVVISLSLVVYGQIIYFATPIINFLLNTYPIKSTYHSIWSILTMTIEALSKWESWTIIANAPKSNAWLHAHKN